MGDITIGQMYPASSAVHRLDPRFKIVFTIMFVVMLFTAGSALTVAVNAAFVLIAYTLAKIPLKMLVKTLRPVIPIVVFMLIFNVLFYSGETVLLKLWIFKITLEGLKSAVFMVFRIVLIVAGTSLLTYTTSSIELTDAIESLLSPLKKLKFPVHELAMMMTIALRFIPTLIEETQKIMSAQKARGADFESGNLIARVKALLPILIPLFISAIKRASELATAMESRCYHNGIGRTRLKTLKSGKNDIAALMVMTGLLALVVVLSMFNL
ncbi:MAG: energy-coupling factor transporter transmembrane protein EcfT [Oscillospiraceae bacterium]|nr:energy-coupling factor transporter transmembrane protein EcfT [Oscillospiraceae bacterium]